MGVVKKLIQLSLGVPVAVLALAAPASALVANPAPAAKVSFTFDDGLQDAITQAAPTLQQYGLTGTDYIITGCVGMTTIPNTCAADTDVRYMTWDQITQLQNTYGWEIGSHTVSHPQLATDNLTDTQLTNELVNSKQALADHGFNATDIATPYGDYDSRVLAAVAKVYASHRGFADVDNNVWAYNDYLLNDFQVQAGVTVAQVKAAIDAAIANNHWLVLTFHGIEANASTDPEDYQYKTSDLAAIAAYVKTKQDAGQIKNVNINQGLITSDTNLFTNGDLAAGLSSGWSTTSPSNVVADANNHGSYPEPQHAVAFTAGTSGNVHLFSPKVSVSSSQTYMVKSFLNLATRTSGELGYYIDEYDSAGNWISGQWKLAKTTPFVQEVNFTYKPTSANVKRAALQVYATANSGITAYVDNFQFFSLNDVSTPPAPATNNLLANSSFNDGLASGWSTNNASAFTADNGSHGAPADAQNAIKLLAGTSNSSLFAPQVVVQPLSTYTINAYLNVLTRSSEEAAFYIDEYDISGNWISGQYATAVRTTGISNVSFSYNPSSPNVHTAGLQVILVGGSGITGYLDEVQFLAPPSETPTPPPAPEPTPEPEPTPTPTGTNLMPNGTFDGGLAEGWSTNDPTNITADSGNHGSLSNQQNAIKVLSSTQNRHLFAPLLSVDPAKAYQVASFVDLQQITSGEVGFYIDEYDISGNWISGQYKTGVRVVSAGDTTFTYTPSSANVSKAGLQIIVVGNSGIQAYIDDIRWFEQ